MKTMFLEAVALLNRLMEWLVVIALVFLSFVVLAQIVTRQLHISVAWLEEAARYSMIYVCFLGAAVCTGRNALIKVDVLYEILPQRACRLLYVLVDIVCIIFLCIALYSCFLYLPLGFKSDASSMKGVRMFWFYLALPLGIGMMLLNTIANMLKRGKEEESA